jgi:hypothetical protein
LLMSFVCCAAARIGRLAAAARAAEVFPKTIAGLCRRCLSYGLALSYCFLSLFRFSVRLLRLRMAYTSHWEELNARGLPIVRGSDTCVISAIYCDRRV